MTDLFTERAIDYVTRRRTGPFYLSVHYNAPHWPWQDRKGGEQVSFTDKTPGPATMSQGGSLELYSKMVRSLDDGIGPVMRALKAAGRDRNTLVIFTSDNGGERFSYHWPFAGEKGNLLEGGIRVPAIIRWPGTIPANRVTRQMAITMDWTATMLAAAATEPAAAYWTGLIYCRLSTASARSMTVCSSGVFTIETLSATVRGNTFAMASNGDSLTSRLIIARELILLLRTRMFWSTLSLSLRSGTSRCCPV